MLSPDSSLSKVLDHREARAILEKYLAGILNSPMLQQLKELPISQVMGLNAELANRPDELANLWRQLANLPKARSHLKVVHPRTPMRDYEPSSVGKASASTSYADSAACWDVFEVVIDGPGHGNPFTDVDLTAVFAHANSSEQRIGGFYDGDGTYKVRFMPDKPGNWTFRTSSNARSLDGIEGSFDCSAPSPGNLGPVKVADKFHFAHADGRRYSPIGTTAYAWTHQPAEVQERTLQTLAGSPFNKIRMCVFPKSYLFNANEPDLFPYERTADGWDFTRFKPEFFRHLEGRIQQLAALGIEADLILFHAYDRWGFSDMGAYADDQFVRYVVRRLAAHRNIWWSLANEYDLLRTKTTDDWERMAEVITTNDPTGHLLSIHNCFGFYDYSKPWITHASTQRIDVYRTAENTDQWRETWGKPVVIDECAYEGDIDQGWGNITGEEMVRRFWEGAVRGGYVGHGETYLNESEELWWSKGGNLVGSSPERIGFLAEILEQAPGGVLDPLPGDWDAPRGGVPGVLELIYFGFNRPSYRTIMLPPDTACTVDIIDTWNMTIETLDGQRSGIFRVALPARQYMAIRLNMVEGL
ncbi:DUF5605 domain-containing protein [Pseudarthrobacter sp. DSP2-3-2b1]|uniref:DUF5605 domain-containing protein n=1 Tax=Pseudarthrobacter sp. DSP2-3-2b1 TaxID=2804661 RepID=UPI003CE9314D